MSNTLYMLNKLRKKMSIFMVVMILGPTSVKCFRPIAVKSGWLARLARWWRGGALVGSNPQVPHCAAVDHSWMSFGRGAVVGGHEMSIPRDAIGIPESGVRVGAVVEPEMQVNSTVLDCPPRLDVNQLVFGDCRFARDSFPEESLLGNEGFHLVAVSNSDRCRYYVCYKNREIVCPAGEKDLANLVGVRWGDPVSLSASGWESHLRDYNTRPGCSLKVLMASSVLPSFLKVWFDRDKLPGGHPLLEDGVQLMCAMNSDTHYICYYLCDDQGEIVREADNKDFHQLGIIKFFRAPSMPLSDWKSRLSRYLSGGSDRN